MKMLTMAVVLLGMLALLAYTNPSLTRYEEFVGQRVLEEARKQKDPLAGAIGSMFSGFVSSMLVHQTARRDYVFFSTYDTPLGQEHIKALGVLNNFFITEPADFQPR